MEEPAEHFAGMTPEATPLDSASRPRKDWRLVRLAPRDLQLMTMPRVNLLVMGADSAIRIVLDRLLPALEEPIATWQPGEPLVLPPGARGGTMILHDVGALTHEDQRRLLEWSQQAAGRTRLVSTTTQPLFPRVEAGAFIDTLYYRLNTVCVDTTIASWKVQGSNPVDE